MKKESIFEPFLKIFLCYLVYMFLVILFSSFIKDENILYNIFVPIADVIMIFLTFYVLKDKLKNPFKDFKKNWKTNLKKIFKYWLIGLVLMIVTNLIINVFIMNGIAPNEETNRSILNQYPFYAILTMCLLAPIEEELLFRLNFKNVFKKKTTFVLVTGIIFGAMHVITGLTSPLYLLYLIPYSILGFTFALIFYETDNIASSILAHIIHNTLTITIVLLGL